MLKLILLIFDIEHFMEKLTKINKYRIFKNEFDLNDPTFVRVHNKNVSELGGRNSWIKINNNDKSIYRMIRGKKSTKGFGKNCIEMDYDSIAELGLLDSKNSYDEFGFYDCTLTLSSVGFIGSVLAHWHHPDNIYRVPLRISLISLLIGILGFVGGVIN